MIKQKPKKELVGFELFKRSQVINKLEWNRKGYWINKAFASNDFRREPGLFCPDCILPLSEIIKTREFTAHLKCDSCGTEINKREHPEWRKNNERI